MSSYAAHAIHPATGETEPALFLDDHFGPRRYGVKFRDGNTFRREDVRQVVGYRPMTSEEAVALFLELTTPEEFPAVHAGNMRP